MTQPDQNSVLVPNSILTASRCELSDLSLHIEGKLPEDIQGHFFMVAPVGTIDSGGLPHPNGDSLINGDGMIYRIDLNQATLKTKLVKPPDYYADAATQSGRQYASYGFRNHGLARFSFSLGLRDQLNTAFLPMPFPSDAQQRLLVTYDAGRPFEIDTESLETVTPVGANAEWRSETAGFNFPFPPILSTAHPAFDAYTEEMFSVNYGRSVENFLKSIPLTLQLQEFPKEMTDFIAAIGGFFSAELIQRLFKVFDQLFESASEEMIQALEAIAGIELENFVYLIRWNGQSNLERWKVVLADGSPIKIEQTMHQIGISQDYIVLMDTAFIAGMEQVLNNPIPESKKLEALLREVLETPPNPDSVIYIIPRQNLKRGQFPAWEETEVEVVAQKLTLPMEAAHFLMDYENPEGQITLHVAHICAWNVAEWIRNYDVSAYDDHSPLPKGIYSMENSEMDISRFGRYVIKGKTGELVKSNIIHETPLTWGPGLYAYLDRLPSGLPPAQLDNIYWVSFGLWSHLITEYGKRLYEDYQYRVFTMSEVLALAKAGIPCCLLRLNTANMEIADSYQVPTGIMISSPQFIPRQSSQGESTDGYLLCSAFTNERSEFWLFEGENLRQGPICKLSHPSLNFGYSLHTTWLPSVDSRKASYQVPVNVDYEAILAQQSDPMIQKLFYEEIYPHFFDFSTTLD